MDEYLEKEFLIEDDVQSIGSGKNAKISVPDDKSLDKIHGSFIYN